MSIYGGFATRQLENFYNKLIGKGIDLLCNKIITYMANDKIGDILWKKKMIKLFRTMDWMEKQKYMDPKYSNNFSPLIEYFRGKKDLRENINSSYGVSQLTSLQRKQKNKDRCQSASTSMVTQPGDFECSGYIDPAQSLSQFDVDLGKQGLKGPRCGTANSNKIYNPHNSQSTFTNITTATSQSRPPSHLQKYRQYKRNIKTAPGNQYGSLLPQASFSTPHKSQTGMKGGKARPRTAAYRDVLCIFDTKIGANSVVSLNINTSERESTPNKSSTAGFCYDFPNQESVNKREQNLEIKETESRTSRYSEKQSEDPKAEIRKAKIRGQTFSHPPKCEEGHEGASAIPPLLKESHSRGSKLRFLLGRKKAGIQSQSNFSNNTHIRNPHQKSPMRKSVSKETDYKSHNMNISPTLTWAMKRKTLGPKSNIPRTHNNRYNSHNDIVINTRTPVIGLNEPKRRQQSMSVSTSKLKNGIKIIDSFSPYQEKYRRPNTAGFPTRERSKERMKEKSQERDKSLEHYKEKSKNVFDCERHKTNLLHNDKVKFEFVTDNNIVFCGRRKSKKDKRGEKLSDII